MLYEPDFFLSPLTMHQWLLFDQATASHITITLLIEREQLQWLADCSQLLSSLSACGLSIRYQSFRDRHGESGMCKPLFFSARG